LTNAVKRLTSTVESVWKIVLHAANKFRVFVFKAFTSRIALHIYFWLVLFLFFFLYRMGPSGSWNPDARWALIIVATFIVPVYYHFYLFENLFSVRKYAWYGVLLVLGIIGWAFFLVHMVPATKKTPTELIGFSVSICLFIGVTTALKLLRNDMKHRLQLQELKAQQLQTELHLLKSQINPHFLFNTLNNLFSLARKNSPGTADGIAHLSHLMRYMIYESSVERIGGDKEVEQIQRIIELQKLRYSKDDPVRIDFDVQGDPAAVQLPPMILVPFVENAFKFGLNPTAPSFISIQLHFATNSFAFSIRNSVHEGQEPRGNGDKGLGLQNVRRQLEILYPKNHELLIGREGDTFSVTLRIFSLS
jgi:two-component system LytT family sensor kinase